MPSFYAVYQDPVPAQVLKLDYLDREIQLQSQTGDRGKVTAAVKQLGSTWGQLRPQLIRAGGLKVAGQYDAHVRALQQNRNPAAVQKQAVHGLDVVDLMEGVFLKK